jgi:hypothetical protein
MTAIGRIGIARTTGEGPKPGRRQELGQEPGQEPCQEPCQEPGRDPALDAACDPQLVGRTSAPAPGRALVPTTSSHADKGPLTRRPPSAAFLAHLIATAQQAPQTRVRRRAEPGEVRAVYAAVAAAPANLGRKIYRSL